MLCNINCIAHSSILFFHQLNTYISYSTRHRLGHQTMFAIFTAMLTPIKRPSIQYGAKYTSGIHQYNSNSKLHQLQAGQLCRFLTRGYRNKQLNSVRPELTKLNKHFCMNTHISGS